MFSRTCNLFVIFSIFLLLGTQQAFAASVTSKASASQNASCSQLPANFDPLQASESQLHLYHLPPRPQGDNVQLQDWVRRLKGVKHLICKNEFTRLNHPITTIDPQLRKQHKAMGITNLSPLTSATSGNWAGYEAYGSDITDAKGHWNTQCLGAGNPSGARLATWVGIGGINGNLVQTGTTWTSSGYHLFYEFLPGPTFVDSGSTLPCGTPVDAEVYHSNTDNLWCTFISYSGGSYGDCFGSSYQADRSTSEWIDERPSTCTNGLPKLANFQYTDFSNGYAYSPERNWHTIGGWAPVNDTMVDTAGTTLAQPAALNSGTTSFRDYWRNYGNGVNCIDA